MSDLGERLLRNKRKSVRDLKLHMLRLLVTKLKDLSVITNARSEALFADIETLCNIKQDFITSKLKSLEANCFNSFEFLKATHTSIPVRIIQLGTGFRAYIEMPDTDLTKRYMRRILIPSKLSEYGLLYNTQTSDIEGNIIYTFYSSQNDYGYTTMLYFHDFIFQAYLTIRRLWVCPNSMKY